MRLLTLFVKGSSLCSLGWELGVFGAWVGKSSIGKYRSHWVAAYPWLCLAHEVKVLSSGSLFIE